MIDLLGAIVVVVLFVVLLDLLKVVEQARSAIAISQKSMETMRNAELDDDTKERELQKGAIGLFRLMLTMSLSFATSLVAPMALIWLLDLAGFMSLDAVSAMLLRWDFMLGATVLGVGLFVVLNRRDR